MDQPTNFNFLISNDASLRQSTKTAVKIKCKPKIYKKGRRKCNECDKERLHLDESHQICHTCYKANTIFKLSGNKVIDDFIRRTQIGDVMAWGEWSGFPMTNSKMYNLLPREDLVQFMKLFGLRVQLNVGIIKNKSMTGMLIKKLLSRNLIILTT